MGRLTSFLSALGYQSPGKTPKGRCTSEANRLGRRIQDPISGLINCAQDGLVLAGDAIWPGVLSADNPRGAYQLQGVWYITPSEAQRQRNEPIYLPGEGAYDAAGNLTTDPRAQEQGTDIEAVKGQRNLQPSDRIQAEKGRRNLQPREPALLDGVTGMPTSLADTVDSVNWLGGSIRETLLAGRLPDLGLQFPLSLSDRSDGDVSDVVADSAGDLVVADSAEDLLAPTSPGAIAKPMMEKARLYLALLTIAVVLYFVYMLGQRGK